MANRNWLKRLPGQLRLQSCKTCMDYKTQGASYRLFWQLNIHTVIRFRAKMFSCFKAWKGVGGGVALRKTSGLVRCLCTCYFCYVSQSVWRERESCAKEGNLPTVKHNAPAYIHCTTVKKQEPSFGTVSHQWLPNHTVYIYIYTHTQCPPLILASLVNIIKGGYENKLHYLSFLSFIQKIHKIPTYR